MRDDISISKGMKAYSVSLRSQIVKAYRNKEGSMAKLAIKFGVSRSFVQKLITRERTTGSIAPLPRGTKKTRLINRNDAIKKLILENQNATLKDLCVLIEELTGLTVSQSTVCRFRQKIRQEKFKIN